MIKIQGADQKRLVLTKALHDGGYGIREIMGCDELPIDFNQPATTQHRYSTYYQTRYSTYYQTKRNLDHRREP